MKTPNLTCASNFWPVWISNQTGFTYKWFPASASPIFRTTVLPVKVAIIGIAMLTYCHNLLSLNSVLHFATILQEPLPTFCCTWAAIFRSSPFSRCPKACDTLCLYLEMHKWSQCPSQIFERPVACFSLGECSSVLWVSLWGAKFCEIGCIKI